MPRIAFYSHDTMGLGHVRRNLLLAEAFTRRDPATTALLISGVHVGASFQMPPNVDCITLPALTKDRDGAYGARRLSLPLTRLTHLRTRTTRAALLAFDPDLVVVDNAPRGAMGEVEPALAALKSRGRTRLVLGLRDVLDEPEAVAREWSRSGYHQAIARYYDQIWVYGDPQVYDLSRECRFPAGTARKIRYVGYLDRRRPRTSEHSHDQLEMSLPDRFALCMSGGGQDGTALTLAFGRARGAGIPRVILGGPFLPDATRTALHELAAQDPSLHIIDFSSDATRLIERATSLVTMGGYNTVCEALAYRKPTLIVPREWPRREQFIRAERLCALGLADMLPSALVTPDALRQWLDAPMRCPTRNEVRFTALARVPALATELLTPPVLLHASAARHRRLLAN
jgi:predicted glycosyltransferase